jgi:allantoinase
LKEGLIEQVVTDHSPSTAGLKCTDTGDFLAAWGGIASLQIGLRATWTEASARGHDIVDLARWMSEVPARRVGLWGRKGAIAAGFDADLVAWDPEAWRGVDLAELRHRNPVTPYAGERLKGVVHRTWLRGREIYGGGTLLGPPSGAWITA